MSEKPQVENPLLTAAKNGLIPDHDIARVICATHSDRVQRGIANMQDDCGGPSRPGQWKIGRSS